MHDIIIGHFKFVQTIFKIIPPQLNSVKWCAKCPEWAYFDINCTHITFTNKHIALSIQFTALPLYVFIITKVINESDPDTWSPPLLVIHH